jgi:uncharacterized protein
MTETNPKTKPKPEGRLVFPGDEARLPWLPMLLEAYHITDRGVAEGIRREEAQGRKLACHKGCAACCRSHKTIPVYPLELMGISWCAVEKLESGVREKLKTQLSSHKSGEACLLLVDNLCSIHPMRPMACRPFNLFSQVCTEGEDAYYTRRQDVLMPIKKYTDEALYAHAAVLRHQGQGQAQAGGKGRLAAPHRAGAAGNQLAEPG